MRRCLSEPPDVERAIVAAPSGRFSGTLKTVLSVICGLGNQFHTPWRNRINGDYSTAAPEVDT
jgi:hypothetical protein